MKNFIFLVLGFFCSAQAFSAFAPALEDEEHLFTQLMSSKQEEGLSAVAAFLKAFREKDKEGIFSDALATALKEACEAVLKEIDKVDDDMEAVSWAAPLVSTAAITCFGWREAVRRRDGIWALLGLTAGLTTAKGVQKAAHFSLVGLNGSRLLPLIAVKYPDQLWLVEPRGTVVETATLFPGDESTRNRHVREAVLMSPIYAVRIGEALQEFVTHDVTKQRPLRDILDALASTSS